MNCLAGACLFIASSLQAVDGDTFKGGDRSYRLWGYDTSEYGSHDYYEHKQLMKDILESSRFIFCEDKGYATTDRGSWKCKAIGGKYHDSDLGWIMCAAGYAEDVPYFSDGYYKGCKR